MLITAVPSKPDYLRVKLRRRVQRLGAVGLKGAVYVLPENPEAFESFQWLRREILADGGDATVCLAQLVDGMSDADVIALFNQDRDAEYEAFVTACQEFEAGWPAGAAGDDRGPAGVDRRAGSAPSTAGGNSGARLLHRRTPGGRHAGHRENCRTRHRDAEGDNESQCVNRLSRPDMGDSRGSEGRSYRQRVVDPEEDRSPRRGSSSLPRAIRFPTEVSSSTCSTGNSLTTEIAARSRYCWIGSALPSQRLPHLGRWCTISTCTTTRLVVRRRPVWPR